MRFTAHSIRLAALVVGATLLTACTGDADPAGLAPEDPSFAASGATLLECPVDHEISATGTFSALGGLLSLRDHQMTVPLLAITLPTEFRVAAPASRYMELAVTPAGGSGFQFNRPVSITIDYSRCPRALTDRAPLTVWQIDPESKALLEHMGGVDDDISRTITFQSDHLSHFSIAQ